MTARFYHTGNQSSKACIKQVLGERHIGMEARARPNDHVDTRVWLRLLACTTQIEQQIRHLLRTRLATTLRRFDYMAQLERHPGGLHMNDLSRYLMVTGGNVTGLTDALVKDGMVERTVDTEDRRFYRVCLTPAGRAQFAAMATEHEKWLTEMFGSVPLETKQSLYEQLGLLRVHVRERQAEIETTLDSESAASAEGGAVND